MSAYGDDGPWGVLLELGTRDERWYSWRGEPKPMLKEYAQALAATLNRGGMSGVCTARPLPPPVKPSEEESK